MAKVGNEAKLILRLAKEQMGTKVIHKMELQQEMPSQWTPSECFCEGYARAAQEYEVALFNIVFELEQK